MHEAAAPPDDAAAPEGAPTPGDDPPDADAPAPRFEDDYARGPGGARPFLTGWARALVDRPRRAEVDPLPEVGAGQVGVTFVGHATAILRWPEGTVITDPNLSRWMLGLRRSWLPGVPEGALDAVQVVLISHAHHDHLRRPSLRRLPGRAIVFTPPRCSDLVDDLGFGRVVELGWGESARVGGLEIAAVPARHWGTRMVGDYKRRGYGGYVVRPAGGGPAVYFAGDTGWFSGFGEIGRRFRPDVALLPIGCYRPDGFRRHHMGPPEALRALGELGARFLVPIHFGSWVLSYEPLGEPARWLAALAAARGMEDRVRILGNGGSAVLPG